MFDLVSRPGLRGVLERAWRGHGSPRQGGLGSLSLRSVQSCREAPTSRPGPSGFSTPEAMRRDTFRQTPGMWEVAYAIPPDRLTCSPDQPHPRGWSTARGPRRHAGRRPDVLSIGRFQDLPPSGAGGVSARSGRGGQDQSYLTPVFGLRPWKGWRRMFRSRAGFVRMALRSSSPAQGGRGRWLTGLPLTAGHPVLNGPPCT